VFNILKHLDNKTAVRFCRDLYGYKDKSYYGKYTYEREGLLSDVPHMKLTGSVIITDAKNARKVVNFLKKYNVPFFMRTIKLRKSDVKLME